MENQAKTANVIVNSGGSTAKPPDPLQAAIAETIAAHALLPAGSTIVVAVSGGADSIALLEVLRALAPVHKWRLHVAHVNHRLRAGESDADAAFVAAHAAAKALPCTVRSIDVARAQRDHASPENTARRLRYRELAAIASEVGARRIALAHHQDDQAETVLLHLLRGSGLGGLTGMRFASRLLAAENAEIALARAATQENGAMPIDPENEQDITLVRPLLNVARDDIRAFCARRDLPFREDSSNDTLAPQRNWLRHTVLPLLETRYPAAARTLARAAHVLAEDHEFLSATAADWLRRHARRSADGMHIDHAAWQALPPALQAALLRGAVAEIQGHAQGLERAHVLQARETLRRGETGIESPLPGGLVCRAEHDGIWIGIAKPAELLAPITLAIPGRTAIPTLGCTVRAALIVAGEEDILEGATAEDAWLDAERIGLPLRVRTRLPGDRFLPLGMTGEKKLQDYLVDARVPSRVRDRVPLIVDGDNTIVWVAGHRIDDRYRVTDKTKQVLHLYLDSLLAVDPA